MTTISTLPTAPSRADPATFSDRSDALLGALDTFVTETNTVVTEVNAVVTEVNALAAAMGSLASGAATSIPYTFSTTTTDSDPGAGILRLDNATQNAATTIRVDLVGSDGSTWTSLLDTFDDSTSTIKGFIMLQKASDATKWLLFSVSALASPSGYKNITVANVASSAASPFANADALLLKFTRNGDKGETGATGATGPAGANGINAGVTRSARTANTILGTADGAYLIDITSGTFTQTFTAAATLGNGWYCHIRNSGTGYITLDPNSSETIDGLTSYVMYPGECRLITCTGSAFVSVVVTPFVLTLTSTVASFVWPPGYGAIEAECIGGGGGGGSGRRGAAGTDRAGGSGGGGGCRNRLVVTGVAAGTTFAATVGAGGTGGAAASSDNTNGSDGTAGGTTSFGTYVYAYGGGFGYQGTALSSGYNSGGGGGGSVSAGTNGAASTSGGYGGLPRTTNLGTATSASTINTIGTGGAANYQTQAGCAEWGGGAGGCEQYVPSGGSSQDGGGSCYGGGGGASGGGVGTANNQMAGAAGGASGAYTYGTGASGGAAGSNPGSAGSVGFTGSGGGGGGGGGSSTGKGGNGGAGAAPGGGGGGGGGGTNGTTGSVGGDGGRGEIRLRGIA